MPGSVGPGLVQIVEMARMAMLQQIISHNEPIKVIHEAWEGGYSCWRAACERITLTKLGREQNLADVIGMRQLWNHVRTVQGREWPNGDHRQARIGSV